VDNNGSVIGTIRIKPSGILWKPKGQHKFLRVSLDTFIGWITHKNTGATKVSS
jgi:hypothetical protein